ncbi:PTS sugar transporter subunit IIC [Clostridiaceae bacterium M8S5]|nr:PTS sugar transporter subunit IIC [Clostridiaceae bacterium M8S5]
MQGIMKWIEEVFMPPMAKLSEQRHLKAIRDGIISTLSLIIVGSFFLIIAFPPIPALADMVKPYIGDILIPFRMTMGLMSLYAAYGMGYSLAKSYKLDGVSGGVLSLAAFLMTVMPVAVEAPKGVGRAIPMAPLGGSGMFVAILSMIFAVEILRLFKSKNITIKMPEQVPESVARSFEALFPAMAIVTIVWIVRVLLKFDINSFIESLLKPVVNVTGDSLLGVIVPILFITVLWSAGIHGMSVIGSLVRPIWLVLLDENVAAAAAGKALPHIAPEPFFQWFIWIGGAGATLGLCILLCFSKSEYLKRVGRFSIIPGIFNINEPLMFGAPIVMNPLLAIPFILVPVVNGIIAFLVTNAGIVEKVSIIAPWTLPAPIGAFMATGGDYMAIVLAVVNIGISLILYYPFFKAYEKKMILEEHQQA